MNDRTAVDEYLQETLDAVPSASGNLDSVLNAGRTRRRRRRAGYAVASTVAMVLLVVMPVLFATSTVDVDGLDAASRQQRQPTDGPRFTVSPDEAFLTEYQWTALRVECLQEAGLDVELSATGTVGLPPGIYFGDYDGNGLDLDHAMERCDQELLAQGYELPGVPWVAEVTVAPDLIGLTVDEAFSVLRSDQLMLEASDGFPLAGGDVIVAQDPMPGGEVSHHFGVVRIVTAES